MAYHNIKLDESGYPIGCHKSVQTTLDDGRLCRIDAVGPHIVGSIVLETIVLGGKPPSLSKIKLSCDTEKVTVM